MYLRVNRQQNGINSHKIDLPLAGWPKEAHRVSGFETLDVAHVVEHTHGSPETRSEARQSGESTGRFTGKRAVGCATT